MSKSGWAVEGTGGNCTALVMDAGDGWRWLIVNESEAPRTLNETADLFLVGPEGEGQDAPFAVGNASEMMERAENAEGTYEVLCAKGYAQAYGESEARCRNCGRVGHDECATQATR